MRIAAVPGRHFRAADVSHLWAMLEYKGQSRLSAPIGGHAEKLFAVSIPGEAATLPARRNRAGLQPRPNCPHMKALGCEALATIVAMVPQCTGADLWIALIWPERILRKTDSVNYRIGYIYDL